MLNSGCWQDQVSNVNTAMYELWRVYKWRDLTHNKAGLSSPGWSVKGWWADPWPRASLLPCIFTKWSSLRKPNENRAEHAQIISAPHISGCPRGAGWEKHLLGNPASQIQRCWDLALLLPAGHSEPSCYHSQAQQPFIFKTQLSLFKKYL